MINFDFIGEHWRPVLRARIEPLEVGLMSDERLAKIPELNDFKIQKIRTDLKKYLDVNDYLRGLSTSEFVEESLKDFKATLGNKDKYKYSGLTGIHHTYIDHKDCCYVSLPGCVIAQKFKYDYKQTFVLENQLLKTFGLIRINSLYCLILGYDETFLEANIVGFPDSKTFNVVQEFRRLRKKSHIHLFENDVELYLKDVVDVLKSHKL